MRKTIGSFFRGVVCRSRGGRDEVVSLGGGVLGYVFRGEVEVARWDPGCDRLVVLPGPVGESAPSGVWPGLRCRVPAVLGGYYEAVHPELYGGRSRSAVFVRGCKSVARVRFRPPGSLSRTGGFTGLLVLDRGGPHPSGSGRRILPECIEIQLPAVFSRGKLVADNWPAVLAGSWRIDVWNRFGVWRIVGLDEIGEFLDLARTIGDVDEGVFLTSVMDCRTDFQGGSHGQ